MGFNFKIMFVMVVTISQCFILILAILLLSLLKVLIIVVLFITYASLKLSIYDKIPCLVIVGIHKMHVKEINIKNRVYNGFFFFFFIQFIQTKKIRTKKILIDQKNYKDYKKGIHKVFKKSL